MSTGCSIIASRISSSLTPGLVRPSSSARGSLARSPSRGEIPARFDQEAFHRRRETLMKGYNERRDRLFTEMEQEAGKKNFSLVMDEAGARARISAMTRRSCRFRMLSPACSRR